MKVSEAIDIICKTKGVFIVKSYIRNHVKLNKNIDTANTLKYFCAGHRKYHKYTFHSYIEIAPGSATLLGFDTAKEVIQYAKNIQYENNTVNRRT